MKLLNSILVIFLSCNFIFAQNANQVYLIGEKETNYEELVAECNTMLLSVTNQSMDLAFQSWTEMLTSMESLASDQGFDLKGVKLWINLFWNEDGSINKLYYYPKPNSKNMDFDQLSSFLEIFSSEYVFPIESESCFSHYGSASFPVRARLNRNSK